MAWNGEVDCPNDNPKKYNTIQLIINQQKFGGIAYNSINLRVRRHAMATVRKFDRYQNQPI